MGLDEDVTLLKKRKVADRATFNCNYHSRHYTLTIHFHKCATSFIPLP